MREERDCAGEDARAKAAEALLVAYESGRLEEIIPMPTPMQEAKAKAENMPLMDSPEPPDDLEESEEMHVEEEEATFSEFEEMHVEEEAPPEPNHVLELYFDADYESLDKARFSEELVDGFRSLG